MNCVQNEKASPTETENGVLKWRKFSNAEVIKNRCDNFSMSSEGRQSSAKTNIKPLVEQFITAKTWKLAVMTG